MTVRAPHRAGRRDDRLGNPGAVSGSEGVALLPLRGPVQRILVLRPRALGDVLLVTPALRALKAGFPAAALHVAVDDVLAPVLRRNPHVDRLWLLPRQRPVRRRDWWSLAWQLARVRFDLVLDLHGSPRTALLARLTGARNRVGYALRGRGRLYNLPVPRDSDRSGKRALQYGARVNLDIVARCGVAAATTDDASLVFVPDPAVEERLRRDLESTFPGRPRVGLAPAGTWQAKTYPAAAWAEVADRLAAAGCHLVLLWGPGERGTAEAVQRNMRVPAPLAPATDLEELAALLGHLDLLLSTDSGVKHLAVARGTPSLTVFGPTSPRAWMPPAGPHAWVRARLPCLECNLSRCTHHLCMRLLAPQAVAERALALLQVPFGVELQPPPG